MSLYRYRCHLYTLMNCLARVAVTYDGEYEETGPFHNHNGELTLINEYNLLMPAKKGQKIHVLRFGHCTTKSPKGYSLN